MDSKNLHTYCVIFKNTGLDIKADSYMRDRDDDRLSFFIGTRLVAMFNLSQIMGFYVDDEHS